MPRRTVFLLIALNGLALPASAAVTPAADLEFFEKKIRPILVEHCYSCHSAEAVKSNNWRGKLLLDTREGVRNGGMRGPAVISRLL